MECVKLGGKYTVLKDKDHVFRIRRSIYDYIINRGINMGFTAGVYHTKEYILNRLNYMRGEINNKTRKLIEREILTLIDVQDVIQSRDRLLDRLLASLFRESVRGHKEAKKEK